MSKIRSQGSLDQGNMTVVKSVGGGGGLVFLAQWLGSMLAPLSLLSSQL